MKYNLKLTLLIIVSSSCLLKMISSYEAGRKVLNDLEGKPTKEMFKSWHAIFNRAYDINSETGLQRYKIFKANLKFIKSVNDKNLGYTLGLTPFTDMTQEEFEKTMFVSNEAFSRGDVLEQEDEEEHDWEQRWVDFSKIYPGVKNTNNNQFTPHFAVVGAFEGVVNMKKTTPFNSYSEQYLIDCTTSTDIRGLFEAVRSLGLPYAKDYPYVGTKQPCRDVETRKVLSINKCDKEKGDLCEPCDLDDIFMHGPVTELVAFDWTAAHYVDGRFVFSECGSPVTYFPQVKVHKNKKRVLYRTPFSGYWGMGGYFGVKTSKNCFKNYENYNVNTHWNYPY